MDIDNKYIVATQCFTYNHSQYIEDSLKGFAIQETSFPVVYIIVDDASTDGEQEVLRKWVANSLYYEKGVEKWKKMSYGYMTFAPLKGNINSLFLILLLSENHYQTGRNKQKLEYISEWLDNAKYHAICEGDDYWIDPLKLQKQVDFLESNPDFGLVYTNHYNRTGDIITTFKEKGYTSFDELLVSSGIGTLTSCYKAVLFNQYLKDVHPENKNWLMGDAPLWKYVAFHSKIKFLPDYTSVYRILENSASHSNDTDKQIAFVNSGYDIQKFFIDKYVLDEKKRNYYYQIILEKKVVRSFNIFYAKRDLEIVRKYMKEKWKFLRCRNWFVLRIKEMILWLGIKRRHYKSKK